MRVMTTFPYTVREIENVWIPMPDGARLAARVWMPADAGARPVPVILEAIPYRKRDDMRWRDEPMHRWFAGHGYAAVRLDVRGSGDSDGWLADEYTEREQEDASAAIAWIAAQPWCNGAVGMMGKSWGGFAALQAAAKRPPALRAVLIVHASDDRYTDDAHYMGGCLLTENLRWGSVLLALAAQPPDPMIAGDTWRETWRDRLDHIPLFPATWMRHPQNDAYWRQGSVRDEIDRIACPVFAIGGWTDAYVNAVGRLMARLQVPCRGLIGPWAHVYPHDGVPGPAIGFLQEARAWWDRWLRADPRAASAAIAPTPDTAALRTPALRAWMREHARDAGRWVAADSWPPARVQARCWSFASGRLVAGDAPPSPPLAHRSSQTIGSTARGWCGFAEPATWPEDSSADDAGSMCFETEPLAAAIEILGTPVVQLACATDRSPAFVAVRLVDVAPGGAATRVTYMVQALDATSSEIRLNDVAYRFAAGHRIRVAISTSYWPVVWPSPEALTLRVFPSECSLVLPVRPPDVEDAVLPPFAAPEEAASDAAAAEPGVFARTVTYDTMTGERVEIVRVDAGEDGAPIVTPVPGADLETGHGIVERFVIRDQEPLSARIEIEHRTVRRRPGWEVRVDVRVTQWASRDAFHLTADLEAFEGGTQIVNRRWNESIPRDPTEQPADPSS